MQGFPSVVVVQGYFMHTHSEQLNTFVLSCFDMKFTHQPSNGYAYHTFMSKQDTFEVFQLLT